MPANLLPANQPSPLPVTGLPHQKTSFRFKKSSAPLVGASTWTTEGEYRESTSQKIRLMVGDKPQFFIALEEERNNKSFYKRIRDYFTHVSVETKNRDPKRQTISLNLGSLSKRTHLSIALILLLIIRGKLTLDYIEKGVKKAEESIALFDRMIENGRARAIANGKNPNAKVEEIKDVLKTVLKSRRLASGVLALRGETAYIAFRDQNNTFILAQKGDLLGEGTYGFVYEALNLGTGQLEAFKIAKEDNNKNGILNEHKILSDIHKNGHVKGIQDAPHFVVDLLHPEYGEGYIISKYDFNLNDVPFLKKTPMFEKLFGTTPLFSALKWLHEHGIIHCDIKPANCCSHNKELQIADFGHVRLCENVSPEQPLGVCTPYFTAESDQEENKRITLTFFLHQLALGKIKNPIAKVRILHSAIEFSKLQIDRQAAKYSVASLLLKLNQSKLTELNNFTAPDKLTDLYQTEMDAIRKNPSKMRSRQLELSNFSLNQDQMEQLKKDSIALCKRHDVYGFAVSLLCIFLGVRFISPKNLEPALNKFSKLPELSLINPGLTNLLKQMMNKDGSKRPSIKRVSLTYESLLKKLPALVTSPS